MSHRESVHWVTTGLAQQLPQIVSGVSITSSRIPRDSIAKTIDMVVRNDLVSGGILGIEIWDEYTREKPVVLSSLTSSLQIAYSVPQGTSVEVSLRKAYRFFGTPLLTSDVAGAEVSLSLELE